MPRPLVSALAAAMLITIALTGCTQSAAPVTQDSCSGKISKVLLSDDSATKVVSFNAGDVPKIFAVSATPAPTCYYSSSTTAPQDGVEYTTTQRTLLYIGLSDAQVASMVAALRKTVSVAPWSLRYDDGTASPSAAGSPTTSARWYYNFGGKAQDDRGEMGYASMTPVSVGIASQAGLEKPVNVLRIETQLRQVKK
ncbi:hypothetical protein ACFPJ4_05215 [Lysinimonas soli]|uniref:DUF3558 domain-containing protein n=1 Tax=Lysinimonas soli TaxID=1074233 RepID=A0ABW0NNY6_9MICO